MTTTRTDEPAFEAAWRLDAGSIGDGPAWAAAARWVREGHRHLTLLLSALAPADDEPRDGAARPRRSPPRGPMAPREPGDDWTRHPGDRRGSTAPARPGGSGGGELPPTPARGGEPSQGADPAPWGRPGAPAPARRDRDFGQQRRRAALRDRSSPGGDPTLATQTAGRRGPPRAPARPQPAAARHAPRRGGDCRAARRRRANASVEADPPGDARARSRPAPTRRRPAYERSAARSRSAGATRSRPPARQTPDSTP